MNEGAALRVLTFLNDTSQNHLATLASEKRKVTVIGEEHEPDELEEEEPSSNVINPETAAILTSEQIKEFFKAVEEGSIDRLDELFDSITNVDPNMTYYTESLLMTAIRAKRHKVAEYLIDQLAINVNHTTELIEFRAQTKIPIRERILSCRDLAYDKGLMDLVDLIDIASDDVKPSIKRYLQRRLKKRLDEIHEAYLKRMKERSHRLIIQSEKKNSEIQELSDEQEKENEELPNINIPDDNSSPPPPPPPMPVIIHRPYKSHINETIQNIASKNDLSIDESGKKVFRFSGYTLRYRLVETGNTNQQMNNEQSQFKSTPFLFPFTPSITTTRPLPRTFSRPATTATATNHNRRSISEIGTRIPIRETRTSICRSARRISTARAAPTVIPEVKPTINTTPRLLTKRIPQSNRTYGYIPQIQNALYNEPRHFRPITLKATAIGLSANTRLLRD